MSKSELTAVSPFVLKEFVCTQCGDLLFASDQKGFYCGTCGYDGFVPAPQAFLCTNCGELIFAPGLKGLNCRCFLHSLSNPETLSMMPMTDIWAAVETMTAEAAEAMTAAEIVTWRSKAVTCQEKTKAEIEAEAIRRREAIRKKIEDNKAAHRKRGKKHLILFGNEKSFTLGHIGELNNIQRWFVLSLIARNLPINDVTENEAWIFLTVPLSYLMDVLSGKITKITSEVSLFTSHYCDIEGLMTLDGVEMFWRLCDLINPIHRRFSHFLDPLKLLQSYLDKQKVTPNQRGILEFCVNIADQTRVLCPSGDEEDEENENVFEAKYTERMPRVLVCGPPVAFIGSGKWSSSSATLANGSPVESTETNTHTSYSSTTQAAIGVGVSNTAETHVADTEKSNSTKQLSGSSSVNQVASTEQRDILDLLDETKGRWVSQKDFLDYSINANRHKFTLKTLQHNREGDSIKWSTKNPAIGQDGLGNFLERTGNCQYSYRYRYFLLHKFDKTITSQVPNGK